MDNLDYAGLIGKSFSVPEKAAMKMSLLVLGDKLHSRMRVWGKVLGINKDYIVAQTTNDDVSEPVLSFYSVDGGTNWAPLPVEMTPEQLELSEQIRGRFFGIPDFEYKVRKDVPAEATGKSLIPDPDELLKDGVEGEEGEGNEEEEEPEEERPEEEAEERPDEDEDADEDVDEDALRRKKSKPKYQILKMIEVARLAHFIIIHDAACRVVVRGAYIMNNKTGRLVRNRTFEGLGVEQATKLRSYLKLSSLPRDADDVAAAAAAAAAAGAPEAAEGDAAAAAAAPSFETAADKRETINSNNRKWFGPSFSASTDFLAPISEDPPEGVWCAKYDPTLPAVAVQNLFFLGSLFYCVPDTSTFGQIYYGNGERNLDMCFQLPGRSN